MLSLSQDNGNILLQILVKRKPEYLSPRQIHETVGKDNNYSTCKAKPPEK